LNGEVAQKELGLVRIKNEKENLEKNNKDLKKEIAELKKKLSNFGIKDERERVNLEIESKREKLGLFIDEKQERGENCAEEIFQLEEIYSIIHKKDSEKTEISEAKKGLTKIKGELSKKGLKFNDIQRINQMCEEISNLQLKVDVYKEQNEAKALIEFQT
jgi:hypothetical protein